MHTWILILWCLTPVQPINITSGLTYDACKTIAKSFDRLQTVDVIAFCVENK